MLILPKLLDALIDLMTQVGLGIVALSQNSALAVDCKKDQSLVTAADWYAHHTLIQALTKLTPTLPVLSEEANVVWDIRRHWNAYWLLDPLDGTQHFIKDISRSAAQKTGEYTINLAYVEAGYVVFGIVYLPYWRCGYLGGQNVPAAYWASDVALMPIQARLPAYPLVMLASKRSHQSPLFRARLHHLGLTETLEVAGALKFCYIASGKADLYYCAHPVYEWDIAAGQAILEAAGGTVVDEQGRTLRYNQRNSLLMPSFTASGIQALR